MVITTLHPPQDIDLCAGKLLTLPQGTKQIQLLLGIQLPHAFIEKLKLKGIVFQKAPNNILRLQLIHPFFPLTAVVYGLPSSCSKRCFISNPPE